MITSSQINKEYWKVMDKNKCKKADGDPCGDCSECETFERIANVQIESLIHEEPLLSGKIDLRESLEALNASV